MNPRVSKRGDYWFPELALAQGPVEIAVTGSDYASLFGHVWAVALEEAGEVALYQYDAAATTWNKKSTITDVPTPVNKMRHISLAFDQAARPIIAYEHVDTQQIYIRQWDATASAFVYRGPFDGVDPVLVNDAVAHYQVNDSDILCYHLTKDRLTLVVRVQREQYSTAYTQETLAEAVYLDQVAALPLRLELAGSTLDAPNTTGYARVTGLYPYNADDLLATASYVPAQSAIYHPIVVVVDVGEDAIGSASWDNAQTATYYPLVIVRDIGTDLLGTTSWQPAGGTYYPVVITEDLTGAGYTSPDNLGTAVWSHPSTGTYYLVVVTVDLTGAGYTSPDDLGTATWYHPTTATYQAI